ncbi:cell wall hydrolase SleB [Bartonella australis AUST/NH1]|uniref:Cell wall hydrolase SleB n=1 Tax=Bartonella australis (strain Aust/NH1) TaxID=1094489 RepID=M1PBQ5_BARAA|nr:cell wall hydrolase [Bartonella australis]AGF74066.1 cell wall hydrolase SleB [Bartonella australis AUST/NH1]
MKKNWWVVFIAFFVIQLVTAGCAPNYLGVKGVDDRKKIKKTAGNALTERECLMRAMYFESNRSSREGMIAVGTVVMNRVNSSAYPKTICGVVGQHKQFAPGVLTRPMTEQASVARAKEAANAVLHGERDKKSKNAMFFHTAGLVFPYTNMHYVRVAGGNAFYEKRARNGLLQVPTNDRPYNVAFAFSQDNSDDVSDFITAGLKSSGSKADRTKNTSVSVKIAQANKAAVPFVVAQLGKIPIPAPAPNHVEKIREVREIQAYTVPSPDKLGAVVAMLEEQHKSR